jgi:hypothetical protein
MKETMWIFYFQNFLYTILFTKIVHLYYVLVKDKLLFPDGAWVAQSI